MKTIYKYQLQVNDRQELDLPYDAQVLTVQMQNGQPHIWALHVPTYYPRKRVFYLFGTGHPIDEKLNLKYINTFQMEEGRLVFHLFEEVK